MCIIINDDAKQLDRRKANMTDYSSSKPLISVFTHTIWIGLSARSQGHHACPPLLGNSTKTGSHPKISSSTAIA
jgi:hypothetical protein